MFADSPALATDVLTKLAEVRRTEGEIIGELATIHQQGALASAGWNGSLAGWLIAKAGMAKYRAQLWQLAATHLEFLPAVAYAITTGAITVDQAAPILRAASAGHRAALTDKFDEPVPSDIHPDKPLWTLDEVFTELAEREPVSSVTRSVKEFLNRVDSERQARDFARLQERRHVQFTPTLDGSWHLEGLLDPLAGASVHSALEELMTPDGATDARSAGQRRADALRDMAESRGSVTTRGVPTVVVTIDNRALTTEVTTLPAAGVRERRLTRLWADLEGAPLPVATARMLACDAQLVPAVLDAQGRVLDVGRAKRLVTPALRRALAIEQPTCMFPRCTVSWRRAHAHHLVPWAQGGKTNLNNLVHLCPRHHSAAHSEEWSVHRDPEDGGMVWTGSVGEVFTRPLPGRAVDEAVAGMSGDTRWRDGVEDWPNAADGDDAEPADRSDVGSAFAGGSRLDPEPAEGGPDGLESFGGDSGATPDGSALTDVEPGHAVDPACPDGEAVDADQTGLSDFEALDRGGESG
ncbi:DUF222 domain-containing protein [Phytomonospora sp. NPDC050363]|uniref:HNH endonuclease signature motif containing protein n=1 Tax=Phytomonospora sp. NPDC050363 TaxID=3155642 RepID=UPI003411BE05